jgi:RNA polymerase sigma-70 factor (ECF subfamily)
VTNPRPRSSYSVEREEQDWSSVIDADRLFEELLCQHERPICSYLARLTGDLARAQELTQETFIRAYRALASGERWDNPHAWLYRVASRLATDEHRRRRLVQWLPLLGNKRDPRAADLETAAAERLDVQAALAALPLQYRTPLLLYVYEGCSVAEVAELLDISVSATKMRLSRAREMFRLVYAAEEEEG